MKSLYAINNKTKKVREYKNVTHTKTIPNGTRIFFENFGSCKITNKNIRFTTEEPVGKIK